MGKTSVVHCLRDNFDVYIGRPCSRFPGGKWGNPFRIGPDGDRDEVCDKHEAWIQTQPQLLAALDELKGKRLGCWCALLRCHGDTLAKLADKET